MMTTNNNRLVLKEAPSTNSSLMALIQEHPDLPTLYSIVALQQTQGRGQRGNTWEAKIGDSLTFSFLLKSGLLSANEHYAVSELAALGLVKTLARYVPEEQKSRFRIKWPNDIYYDDKKVAGILIEHSITGGIVDYSVIGIGLNLNDDTFADNIPNPISMKQITGLTYDIDEVHSRLMKRFGFMNQPFMLGNYAEVHREYMLWLYRRKGYHSFRDTNGAFKALIKDVLPHGHIILEREDGTTSTYAFKEVIFDVD